MNTLQKRKPAKKILWRRWPLLLAITPPVLLAICLIVLAIYETLAANQIKAELARLRAAGQPADDPSLARAYLELTSPEGTHDWAEIIRLAGASERGLVDLEQLPYVGMLEMTSEIVSLEQWAKNTEVAQYLRWRRPLIEKIHQAAQHATPVYQPIEFQGYGTHLPDVSSTRAVIRLLQLEVVDALHHRDTGRAMRGLESMQGLCAAFDWPMCLICDLVHKALQGVHHASIQQSLIADIWNDEQLRQLAEQVGQPREIAQRWRSVLAGERAMLLASLASQQLWQSGSVLDFVDRWLMALPSTQAHMLDAYRRIENLGDEGLEGLYQRARAVDSVWEIDRNAPQSWYEFTVRRYQNYMPTCRGYAGALEGAENSRRLTQTALAIKRFQLQTGRWPDDLTQLGQVGLQPADSQTVTGERFGYEVENELAYLWAYGPPFNSDREKRKVSDTRPKLDNGEIATDWVTTIR